MLLLPLLLQTLPTLTLDLSKPGVAVSPMLYGQMTEEINYSYDGGLYGELVRNRALRNDAQKPAFWSAVGEGSSITLEKAGGPTPALPTSLKVKGAAANEGYWGIPVHPATTYKVSLWAKADAAGAITASLESKDGSTVFARTTLSGVDGTWRKLSSLLTTPSNSAPTKDARLVFRTGERTTWLTLASLFAPTYKNRENGLRPDLMQMLVDMKPKFLRFPGGNYLEGNTFKDRFPWKETLGPLEDRPGHQGTWGYRSSDGLGLMEFLLWCEDMAAKPVLGLFAGYTLNKDHIKEGTELNGFVQDALDEIEFVSGGPKTPWGSVRAKLGHPAPFPLEYVEIGNEDWFDESGSYEGRFVQFYDAIKKNHPKLKVISSTGGKDYGGAQFPITRRRPDLWDEHYYSEYWDMLSQANKYDTYDRKGPKVFVGEWATHDTVAPWQAGAQAGPTPNWKCTLGDAAFMTGMERNSDVVHMSCYAPLLVNVNPGGRQWSLNLIGYDALNSFGSPSYYAQKMFAENLGDRTVPLSLGNVPQQQGSRNRTLPALFASATRDSAKGAVYVKLVNTLATEQPVAFEVKGARLAPDGTLTVLRSDDLKAMNSLEEPHKVSPAKSILRGVGNSFKANLPGYSVSVFTLQSVR
jgi:alpha-N-arabinofuranosidase